MTTIGEAASSGDAKGVLEAMRDKVAEALDGHVPPRDMAALTKRLMEIMRDLEAIDAAEKGDDVGNAAGSPDSAW